MTTVICGLIDAPLKKTRFNNKQPQAAKTVIGLLAYAVSSYNQTWYNSSDNSGLSLPIYVNIKKILLEFFVWPVSYCV